MTMYRIYESKFIEGGIATMAYMADQEGDDPSSALASFVGVSKTEVEQSMRSNYGRSDVYPNHGDYVVIPLSHIHIFGER